MLLHETIPQEVFPRFWFEFLTTLLVISAELLNTYVLPGLHSVLRDMETLEKGQVVGKVSKLLEQCLEITVHFFLCSLLCSNSSETASQKLKIIESKQQGGFSYVQW